MKKIYLAGPMTGLPSHNFPAFHAEAARLRKLGYEVVNPAELNQTPGTWLECMRIDICQLVLCDGLVVLPGWDRSTGARLEHHIAMTLGLPCFDSAELPLRQKA
jgi:hypothetical protein